MAGHDIEMAFGVKSGRKKGKTVDVIPMGMRHQDMTVLQVRLNQLLTKIPNPGTAIQQNFLIACIDF